MSKGKQKKYFRMTKAERASIERGLEGRSSARGMAGALGRAPSAVTEEVRRNRTVCKGPGKGGRVDAAPEGERVFPGSRHGPGSATDAGSGATTALTDGGASTRRHVRSRLPTGFWQVRGAA